MTREEFIAEYNAIAGRALTLAKKARRMGLLSLEEDFDKEKVNNRDILEYGTRLAIDGTDRDDIEFILSNIIEQEKDENIRRLKTIQKVAVLGIQMGNNPRILFLALNSLTDIPLKEDVLYADYGLL